MTQNADPAELGKWVEELTQAWAQAGKPLVAHLDLTFRCDLDCQHCYLDEKTRWPEMNTAKWRDVLDQLAAAGVLFLTWSGGEVTLRPDFPELLGYASQLGMFSRVKTHGAGLDEVWTEIFAANRITRVDISVYSLQDRIHDALTRRPGSLQRTLRAIDLLRAASLRVKISVFVGPDVIEEMPDIAKYFLDRGCELSFGGDLMLDRQASDSLRHLALNPEERLRFEQHKATLLPPKRARDSLPVLSSATVPCQAGRTLVYIAPDGGVTPCVAWPMALGNLHEQSLDEIWGISPLRKQIVAWTNVDRTTCLSCAGGGVCTYCAGEAFKRTGDWRVAPDSFHSGTRAKLQAAELAGQTPLTPAQWATIPDAVPIAPAQRTFVFPIHRPRRTLGNRRGSGE